MTFNEKQYAKWLRVVHWCNSMPSDVAHRMRCAFDWTGAIENLSHLSAKQIASAAASHFGPRHFWPLRSSQ